MEIFSHEYKSAVLNNYVESCMEFAHDTQDLLDRPTEYPFYLTDWRGGYQKSYDGGCGGIDVEWAFHLSDERIKELAPGELLRTFLDLLDNCTGDIENEYDINLVEKIVDKYEKIESGIYYNFKKKIKNNEANKKEADKEASEAYTETFFKLIDEILEIMIERKLSSESGIYCANSVLSMLEEI